MKATITYPTCTQVSPDDFMSFTKVIHLSPNDTIMDIARKVSWSGNIDVQLHIECDKEQKK